MLISRGSSVPPEPGGSGWFFRSPACCPGARSRTTSAWRFPPAQADVDLTDLFATLGLGSHLARYPGELSLGLARRAAIARAFAVRPDFLLLDEPFVSLDEAVAARLRSELTALTTRTRVTTLLVTHRLEEAVQLADRLFFLSDRPARIIFEKALPPPRGTRAKEAIASIAADMRALVAQAATGAGQG